MFVYGFIAHLFLVLNDVLSGCTFLKKSSHLTRDKVTVSKLWESWIKLLYTFVCRFLCEHKFSSHLDRYQSVTAGSYGKSSFILEELPKRLPKLLYHFTFPQVMNAFLWFHLLARFCVCHFKLVTRKVFRAI